MTPAQVSVLTPSFGYGRFIEDAIRSVELQEGISLEHIVQDGSSSDETLEVLDRFPHVNWHSEPDRGQSDALNKALVRSRGRWIAWLNSDEFYLPWSLQALHEHGERYSADLVFGDFAFASESGSFQRIRAQHRVSERFLRLYGTVICSCSMIVRRDILGEDPWDPRMRLMMDRDLYLRLMRKGAQISYLPKVLGVDRRHEAQVTARPWRDYADDYEVMEQQHQVSENTATAVAGRLLHVAAKIGRGSYLREVQARAYRGMDVRWFESKEARRNVEVLRDL